MPFVESTSHNLHMRGDDVDGDIVEIQIRSQLLQDVTSIVL